MKSRTTTGNSASDLQQAQQKVDDQATSSSEAMQPKPVALPNQTKSKNKALISSEIFRS